MENEKFEAGVSSNPPSRLAPRLPPNFKSIQFPRFKEPSDDDEEDDDTWISIGIDLGTT